MIAGFILGFLVCKYIGSKKRNATNSLVSILSICIFSFVIISIFTTVAVNIQSPIANFETDNDWIGYFGNVFGGVIGALVAVFIIYLQKEHSGEAELNQLKLYNKFIREMYLDDILTNIGVLKKEINDEITRCIEKQDELSMLSYPHINLPLENYNIRNSKLVDSDLMSFEVYSRYVRIHNHLQGIESQRRLNEKDKSAFTRYLIEINMRASFEKGIPKSAPVIKFLMDMKDEWRAMMESAITVMNAIEEDVSFIKSNS